jgi:uncharacterized repeat protein (TIGR03833 family)
VHQYCRKFFKFAEENLMPSGHHRQDIRPGLRVRIVEKQNQRSGITTEGIVQDLLTRSAFHPHGIKVRLQSGQVGRVQEVLTTPEEKG